MKCKICAAEIPDTGSTLFCPACLAKLRLPGGSVGSFKTPLPQPVVAAAPPPVRGSNVREVWTFHGDVRWPLAATAHPAGGAVVLDQPDGYRVLHLSAQGACQGALFQIPQGNEPGQLDDPQGFWLAADGSLYVADSANDRISVWEADGRFRQVFGELARPSDVRVDEDGFLYVADAFRRRVLKLSPEGLICLELKEAGGWGPLSEPIALAIDPRLNIYVADRDRNRVVQFSAEGLPLRCWPANAGPGAHAFEQLRDVEVGLDGSIWIGDRDNTRIQRFAPSGGRLGLPERVPEPDLGFEGGTLALLEGAVVVPDRLNDRVVCLTFAS